jgi:hypothetical protein
MGIEVRLAFPLFNENEFVVVLNAGMQDVLVTPVLDSCRVDEAVEQVLGAFSLVWLGRNGCNNANSHRDILR